MHIVQVIMCSLGMAHRQCLHPKMLVRNWLFFTSRWETEEVQDWTNLLGAVPPYHPERTLSLSKCKFIPHLGRVERSRASERRLDGLVSGPSSATLRRVSSWESRELWFVVCRKAHGTRWPLSSPLFDSFSRISDFMQKVNNFLNMWQKKTNESLKMLISPIPQFCLFSPRKNLLNILM